MFKRHIVPTILLSIAPALIPYSFSEEAPETCDAGVTPAPTEMVFEADAGTSVEQATQELVDAGVVTQEEIDAGQTTVTLGAQDSADAGATDSADAGVSPSASQATVDSVESPLAESPLFFESPKMPSRISFQRVGKTTSYMRPSSILVIENASDRESIWGMKFGVRSAEFVTPAEQNAALLVLMMMQEDPASNPFTRESNGKRLRLKLPAGLNKRLANSKIKSLISSGLNLSGSALISKPMFSESRKVAGVTFCELGEITCVSVPLSDDQISVLRAVVVDPDAIYGAIRDSSDLEDRVLRKRFMKWKDSNRIIKTYSPVLTFSELVKSADGKSAILSGMTENLITEKYLITERVTKKPVAIKNAPVDPKHMDNQNKVCR